MTAETPEFERGGTEQQTLDWDVALLEEILDEELYYDAPETVDEYDERRQIALDAQAAASRMRDNARSVAQSLGIDVTDEEFAAWRPGQAEMVKLRNDLGRQRKTLAMIRGVEQFLEDQAEEARIMGVPLRKHQRRVVNDFGDFLTHKTRTTYEGGKSGIIEMPTGTGKTGIFANIAAAVKHGENADQPIRVLVLVPTQTVLNQTMGRKGERGFGKFAPHLNVGAFYEDEKDLSNDVVVMCNASFNELRKQGKLPEYDVVVVDEAHTVIGDTTAENIRDYCADKISIGLTATPEFDEERSAYKLFEHTIHQMKLPEAVKGGLLAPVRAWLKEAKAEINWRTLPREEGAQRAAIRAARLEARKRAAIKLIKQELERGVGVIVRCPPGDDIDHARSFAKELRDTVLVKSEGFAGLRWVDAGFVGGTKQRKRHREELLEYYDEGRVDVLTYVKAIGMGWDSPHAKVLINLAPTTSRVEMVQAVGRVLRLSRGPDGKPIEARVYDFTDPELGDKQYTPLDVLETKSGELLGHESDEMPIPQPRQRRKHRIQAEVVAVDVTTVGTAALENEVEVAFPSDAEVRSSIDRISAEAEVPRAEACRILGISAVTYKGILLNLGSNPDTATVTYGDLDAIKDLYPGLKAEPLPETGYVDALSLAHNAPRFIKAFSLIRFARSVGHEPQRFTAPDGKVRHYFRDEIGKWLLEEGAKHNFRPIIGQE